MTCHELVRYLDGHNGVRIVGGFFGRGMPLESSCGAVQYLRVTLVTRATRRGGSVKSETATAITTIKSPSGDQSSNTI